MDTPTNGTQPVISTCVFCEDDNTHKCIKCQRYYCILHTSRISPQLCQDCFVAVSVLIDEFTKVTEEYDEETDGVITHKSSCKRIRMDGPDYVWYAVAVQQATEQELGAILEFHKFMVSLVESLVTTKRVSKLDQLRNEKPVLSTTTSTRTKQRKTVRQQKSPEDILAASGILPTMPGYDQMLDAMKKALQK